MPVTPVASYVAGDDASLVGWTIYTVGVGRAEARADALVLATEEATAGTLADAQLDDYHGREHWALRWRPPLRLTLRARWSRPASELRGTTGFGFWNDPLDAKGRFVAAPSYVWFFHASPSPALVAGAMRGGRVSRVAIAAGNLALRLPGLDRIATRLGERRVAGSELALPVGLDLTAWHDFAIDWRADGVAFRIDGTVLATTPSAQTPAGPLGFVAWIDNNRLETDASGRDQFGRIDAPGRQALAIERVLIEADPAGASEPG
jgi:hypothetical protein